MNKILKVIKIILSIFIIIFCILQLTDIIPYSIDIAMPLLGLLMFIQGLENYKDNKKLSIFSFLVGLFIFVVTFIKILSK